MFNFVSLFVKANFKTLWISGCKKKNIIFFSPDFALAHVQKLYTDFLASQLESNKAKAEEVVQDFEKAIGKKWP